jgi:transposase
MSTSILYHCFGISQYQNLKIVYQGGDMILHIAKKPDKQFCVNCGSHHVIEKGKKIRILKTLPIGRMPVLLAVHRQRLECKNCGAIRFESLDIALPKKHWTIALGRYVIFLLQFCTVKGVAKILGMNWNTIKDIHSLYLQKKFKIQKLSNFENLEYLGVDEIAIKKGHSYMTIAVNLVTGEVVWVCEGRAKSSLEPFIKELKRQKTPLKAVTMDMWQPYINAVKEHYSEEIIVFDKFHIISACNKMLDKLRTAMARDAEKADKKVYKGVRFLLLEKSENVVEKKSRAKLDELLQLNKSLSKAYILKEELRRLWDCTNQEDAIVKLNQWLLIAGESSVNPIIKFARTIVRHFFGIVSYFNHRVTNAKVEGINNKIKTMKKQAYGFRDMEYFKLRIYFINETRYSLVG